MPYCYKCGNKINKRSEFCQNCGANLSSIKANDKKGNSMLSGLLALLALGGILVAAFLLIGGLIAVLMNLVIQKKSKGDPVWAIGYLAWMIFYPTGLIESSFIIGVISLVVGVGAGILFEMVD